MTETQQRFLRAIAERLAPAEIVEVHLFPSIRQGGTESGVAVVAVEEATPVAIAADAPPPDPDVPDESSSALTAAFADAVDPFDDAELAVLDAGAIDDDVADDLDDPMTDEDVAIEVIPDADLASPHADDELPLDAPAVPPPPADERIRRHTVYTAHYRLVLKGPERGQWECDAVAEADAPLESVSAVVRGVQRRVGDSADAVYFSGDAFRAALVEPVWMHTR